MTTADEATLRKRNLRTVGALAALFLLPLVASFSLYYGGYRPSGSAAHGELMQPPRPLPRTDLRDATGQPVANDVLHEEWSLVYVGDGRCDETCRNTLYYMRQTRLALNNDMTRVSRVFLATANCCDNEFYQKEHVGMIVLDASGPEATELLALIPEQDRPHSIFIVDPLGNLVMQYDIRRGAKGLLSDLRKLLRLSHIG